MSATKMKHRRTSKGVFVKQKNLCARVAEVEKPMERPDFPEFSPGDTVKVHVRIREGEKERVQVYEGVVISRSNRGVNRSFTVRKISHGVGVERIFLESTPKIAKLEVAQAGRVRRAKLYYLRNLEGKAARVEREVETLASAAASAAAKGSKTSS